METIEKGDNNLDVLRLMIINHFTISELKDLCFTLGINYESLPGENTINDKARELITFSRRHGRLDDLVESLSEYRPRVTWSSFDSPNQPTSQIELDTLSPNVTNHDYKPKLEKTIKWRLLILCIVLLPACGWLGRSQLLSQCLPDFRNCGDFQRLLWFGVNLADADLREADLGSAVLIYANLQNADLSGAELHHANLRHANLQNADLSGAILDSADLRYADLRGANLTNARLDWIDLRQAVIDDTTFIDDKTRLAWEIVNYGTEQNLSFVDLSLLHLHGAQLHNANLSGANLGASELNEADLTGANLSGAFLGNTSFRNADLRGTDFTDADFGTELSGRPLLEGALIDALFDSTTIWPSDINPLLSGAVQD
ncbi:MAG: pentapeptide repeat-containing protein [Ardenticatenaceae bacterium]|nr:pentapeptide repeat-containing protein [Ardenticatenaceae bacterium]